MKLKPKEESLPLRVSCLMLLSARVQPPSNRLPGKESPLIQKVFFLAKFSAKSCSRRHCIAHTTATLFLKKTFKDTTTTTTRPSKSTSLLSYFLTAFQEWKELDLVDYSYTQKFEEDEQSDEQFLGSVAVGWSGNRGGWRWDARVLWLVDEGGSGEGVAKWAICVEEGFQQRRVEAIGCERGDEWKGKVNSFSLFLFLKGES